MQEIDALTSIGPRRAASEAERRAARDLQQRLQSMGREAKLEPTRVRPQYGLTHLIHVVAGIVGSVISVYLPLVGLLIAAAATVSAFGDLTGAFHLVRALTPARASQNVVSDENGEKPGLLVLVAHYDAPRTSMLESPRLHPLWPRAIFWSLVVVTFCAAGRLLGLDATWFTVIQFIPTVILIASTPLFADAAIAGADKGEQDNAAGVATVLRLAQTYSNRLEHFDLMVVFTGASASSGLGLRDWLGRHGHELDSSATAVICIDHLTGDQTGYADKEGAVLASRLHPTLVGFAAEDGVAVSSRELSDAYIARAAGLPTLRLDSDTYDFASALIRRIDAEIGPDLA